MKIEETIKKCVDSISQDLHHRYRSWDHCHKAFAVSEKNDRHALELAFYLASWGMYRGSSGLLQKNHLIHEGAVDILFEAEALKLKCSSSLEVTRDDIGAILSVKKKLSDYYKPIVFVNGKEETKNVSSTDTLISKILLGTLGCIPAYDQYFISGLKDIKDKKRGLSTFNETSLNQLFDFIKEHEESIVSAQKDILAELGTHYPVMKIVDMHFWQIGYEAEMRKAKEKEKQKSKQEF